MATKSDKEKNSDKKCRCQAGGCKENSNKGKNDLDDDDR